MNKYIKNSNKNKEARKGKSFTNLGSKIMTISINLL